MRFIGFLFCSLLFICSCQSRKKEEKATNKPIAFKAELLINSSAKLGEGAFWDYENKKLLWVDIENGHLHSLDPHSMISNLHEMGKKIGTVVPVNGLPDVVVALSDGIYLFNPETNRKRLLVYPSQETRRRNNRFNDGKCDPAGRLWVGSMDMNLVDNRGALYMIEKNGSYAKMVDSVSISNGIVWSVDGTKMYYIDTPTMQVAEYAYDRYSGEISNKRIAVNIPDNMGSPDGMAIDAEGNLWIAMWGGFSVTCWEPSTGKLIKKVKVPAPNVTSCAFGGEDLNTLYITTAKVGLDSLQLARYPASGGLFTCEVGVSGVKMAFFEAN